MVLTGLRKLLEYIAHYNELARKSEGEERDEYHGKCKENILKLIDGKFGNISKTIGEVAKNKEEVGCKTCKEAFDYVSAYLNGDHKEISKIEEKYNIDRRGTAMIVDDIIYIDPNVSVPG